MGGFVRCHEISLDYCYPEALGSTGDLSSMNTTRVIVPHNHWLPLNPVKYSL